MRKKGAVSKQLIEGVKKTLLEKKRRLLVRRGVLETEDPFSQVDRVNDNAAVDAEAAEQRDHDRVVVLKLESDNMLRRVRKALRKLKKGGWGRCEKCGRSIERGRLELDPTVSLCVGCEKAKAEKNGR